MTITTFQMLCNEISPLVSQVMLYYRTKLRYFFDVHGQIYLVNVFPSPIIRINFSKKSKTISGKCKTFFAN